MIKNIIFDLGGVLYNIDYSLTSKAFLLENKDIQYNKAYQTKIFDDFETGKINSNEFRKSLNTIYKLNLEDYKIDEIWNKMLLGLNNNSYNIINELSKNYNIVLLSNINQIHYNYAYNELKYLLPLFNKVYFSFQIRMRKPNRDIFEKVLKENSFVPNETLFIDDSIQHIDTANKLNINTLHLEKINELENKIKNKLQYGI
jgi:glucose-1-phosphatase